MAQLQNQPRVDTDSIVFRPMTKDEYKLMQNAMFGKLLNPYQNMSNEDIMRIISEGQHQRAHYERRAQMVGIQGYQDMNDADL